MYFLQRKQTSIVFFSEMWNLFTLQAISNLKTGPNLRSRPSVGRDLSFCSANEPQLPSVAAFAHGEVEPDGAAGVALNEEFIKVCG